MSSIRKCKACNRAVKGHPGPYGMAKCKNVPLEGDEEADLLKTNEVEVVQGFHEVNVDILSETHTHENVVANLCKQNLSAQVVAETLKPNKMVEENLLTESVIENPAEMSEKSECSDEDDEVSHFLDDSVEKSVAKSCSKKDENIHDGPKTPVDYRSSLDEECIDEIPDCSLGEVSFSFGAATSEEERIRLFSQSDNNVDIRNLILGRTFVLCFCDNFDCECEGEVIFDKSLKGKMGVVENMYLDPREDSEIDLKPKVSFAKTGWKANEPNSIKFKLGGISTPGVLSSTGEVVLTASRVVEMVKGRKELSTVITGRLGLSLKLEKEFTETGFRSMLKFKDLKCNLFMIEDEDKDAAEVVGE